PPNHSPGRAWALAAPGRGTPAIPRRAGGCAARRLAPLQCRCAGPRALWTPAAGASDPDRTRVRRIASRRRCFSPGGAQGVEGWAHEQLESAQPVLPVPVGGGHHRFRMAALAVLWGGVLGRDPGDPVQAGTPPAAAL